MVADDPREWAVTAEVIEGSPQPRRPALRRVLVGVVVLALAAWLVHQTRSDRPTAAAPVIRATAVAQPPSVDPNLPTVIAAVALPSGLGLGPVLVPTWPPTLVDPANRTSERVAGLPGTVTNPFEVFDFGGGQFVVIAHQPYSDTEAFLVSSATGAATAIAAGDSIEVGADRASILVTRTDPAGERSVQRYDVAGQAVGPPVAMLPDEFLYAETDVGWLFADWDEWWLRAPQTGEERGRYLGLLAAEDSTLAFGAADGGLTVVTLAAGTPNAVEAHTPSPPVAGIYSAQFSPDGSHLAVHGIDQTVTVHTVLVLDLSTGRWSRLPGTPVRLGVQGRTLALAWTGDVLAVATDDGQAVLWPAGEPAAYAVPG